MQRHLHLVLEIAIGVGEQAQEVGHVGRELRQQGTQANQVSRGGGHVGRRLGGGDLRKGRGSRAGQSLRDDRRQVVVAVSQGDRQQELCPQAFPT